MDVDMFFAASEVVEPQQRWIEVQSATSMGQHYQEESEGRQAEEEWRDLIITILHNVANNIGGTSELKKLTGVSESFCELNLIYCVSNVKRTA